MNGLPAQANRIAIFLIAVQVTCGLLSARAEERPAWRNGISTWNGQGYDLPAISGAGVEFHLPSKSLDRRPYTIPTNPEASNAERFLPGHRLATQSGTTDDSSAQQEWGGLPMPIDFDDRSRNRDPESLDVKTGSKNWQAEPTLPKMDSSVDVQRSNPDFNAGLKTDPVSMSDAGFSNQLGTSLELPADSAEVNSAALATAATSKSDELVEPLPILICSATGCHSEHA